MAQKITWDNKVQGRDLPLVPITQKLTFGELNDLKTKFNANADELEEKLELGGDIGGTVSNPTINESAITNTKLANVATATLKGRASGGTGNVEDLSFALVKTNFNLPENTVEELSNKLPLNGGGNGVKVFRPILGADDPVGGSYIKEVINSTVNLSALTNDPKNTLIEVDSLGGAINITVDITAVNDDDFFEIEFLPINLTNDVTFVAGAGITLNSIDGYLKLDKAFGGTILKYRGGNNFVLIGNLKA